MPSGLSADVGRIAHLAWPVLVGQVAVLAFGTIDTLLLARQGPTELAALAVGSATYITVFVGLMGVLLAIGPIVGQLFGAGQHLEAGRQAHQGVWLALLLSLGGCALLVWPEPILRWAQAEGAVEASVRGYLATLAFALPAALLFTVYRGFNTAVSRPRAVMRLQLLGLAVKLPLSMALAWGVPAWGVPALGAVGCGLATAIVMWVQCLAAAWTLVRDPFYDRFALLGRGLDRPDVAMLKGQLRLGVPMGAGILIEVTGFTFMAIFIARLGTEAVAGHQITSNLVALLFMVPLSLSNAISTLVAQRLGAQDLEDARRLVWNGLRLTLGLALLLAGGIYLLREPVVALYTRQSATPAWHAAETALATAIERSGREPQRDALSGPLLQLVRRPDRPDAPPASADEALATLEPIAEPALAALMALLVQDLLGEAYVRTLYAPFAEIIPAAG